MRRDVCFVTRVTRILAPWHAPRRLALGFAIAVRQAPSRNPGLKRANIRYFAAERNDQPGLHCPAPALSTTGESKSRGCTIELLSHCRQARETPASAGFAMSHTFSIYSDLSVRVDTLWQAITCPADINAEFRPLMKMTFPQGLDDVTAGWRPGVLQFRSWILLGALIPVEYDDLTFEEVTPGRAFLERSALWSQSLWEHRRELTPQAEGTRLADTVTFEPRLAFFAPLYRQVFWWIFRWRHRNLRRMFGHTRPSR
jgi:hypothetical protein